MDEKKLLPILERLNKSRTNASAWDDLYNTLWPYLFSKMYRNLGGNRFLAEESAQEIMLRIFKYADFSRGSLSPISFLSYIKTLCRSLTIEILRSKDRIFGEIEQEYLLSSAAREIVDEHPTPEQTALLREKFGEYLAKLSPVDRDLVAHLMAGKKTTEIATLQRTTVKTVQNRGAILRRKLREIMFRK